MDVKYHVTYFVCTGKLDGALGGDPLLEVLKWGLHLVVTNVVPVGGGADKKSSCAVQYLSEEGLRY